MTDALPPRTNGADAHGSYSRAVEKSPLRLVASDLVVLGLVLSWFCHWTALVFCLLCSIYLRARRMPRLQPAVAIINEAIASNGNVALANFIAPVLPHTKYRWVQTPTGTIPVEEP